jgi:hypothetical protein
MFGLATTPVNASEGIATGQATLSADSKASSFIPVLGMDIASIIDSVDGKAVGAGTHKVLLDPGMHTISLSCTVHGPGNTEELELNAVAGAEYHAHALMGGQRIVPCTSIIQQKLESGKLESVPLTYRVENNGIYRLTEGVVVGVPSECIRNIAIYRRDRLVDFVANQTDWLADGQYTVKLWKIPRSVSDDDSFIKKISPDAKDYVEDRPRDRLDLVLKEAKRVDIHGQPGYRVVAINEGKMAFVATFVLQKTWVSVASLTYRLPPGSDAMSTIPWGCYDKFVDSIGQPQ